MQDESSSSSPAGRRLPSAQIQLTRRRQTSSPILWRNRRPDLCWCHHLRESQQRYRRLKVSPCSPVFTPAIASERCQRRSFSEAIALVPRASPPSSLMEQSHLMERPSATMKAAILESLRKKKRVSCFVGGNPKATDPELQQYVLHDIHDLDPKVLEYQIKEFETMVQKHLDGEEEIVENKDQLLLVFNYLKPSSRSKLRCPQLSSSTEKRSRDGEDDSDINPPKRVSCSESVGEQFTGLELSQNDNLGTFGKCSSKFQQAGVPKEKLWELLDVLKGDTDLREAALALPVDFAIGYVEHRIKESQKK